MNTYEDPNTGFQEQQAPNPWLEILDLALATGAAVGSAASRAASRIGQVFRGRPEETARFRLEQQQLDEKRQEAADRRDEQERQVEEARRTHEQRVDARHRELEAYVRRQARSTMLLPEKPNYHPPEAAEWIRNIAGELQDDAWKAGKKVKEEIQPAIERLSGNLAEVRGPITSLPPSARGGAWKILKGNLCLLLELILSFSIFHEIYNNVLASAALTVSGGLILTSMAHQYYELRGVAQKPADGGVAELEDEDHYMMANSRWLRLLAPKLPVLMLTLICSGMALVRAYNLDMSNVSLDRGHAGDYIMMLVVSGLTLFFLTGAVLYSGRLLHEGKQERTRAQVMVLIKQQRQQLERKAEALQNIVEDRLAACSVEIRSIARLIALSEAPPAAPNQTPQEGGNPS